MYTIIQVVLLCALLAIEAVLWRRTLRQPAEGTQLSRRDKVGWIVPAAVQWGLKAALLTVMLRNLLGNDAGSRLRLLSWLMVLSLVTGAWLMLAYDTLRVFRCCGARIGAVGSGDRWHCCRFGQYASFRRSS